MSTPTDQLAEEYKAIEEKFSNSPYITIVSTEGDPPNKYEIEFHVKGLHKDAEGNTHIENSHRIEIVLPFGFPHFPPSCKPVSPILHPDFDPDAIHIANFWNASRSVADLIIHIGRLITFQSYSSEEVFNQEALDWAKENSGKIPLDKVDFTCQKPKKQQPEQIVEKQPAQQSAPVAPPAIKKKSKKTVIAALSLLVILSGAIAALVAFDLRNFNTASENWREVPSLIDQNKFKDADTKITKINTLLSNVRLLKKNEKQLLITEINTLTGTEKYRNGVKGKLLVNGMYMTLAEVQESKSITELAATAEKLAETAKWHEAAESYQQAFDKAAKLADLSPLSPEELKDRMNRTRLEALRTDAEEFRSREKWDDALASYGKALDVIESLSGDSAPSQKEAVLSLIDETYFLSSMNKADDLFSAGKWSEALTHYDNAIARSTPGTEKFAQLMKVIRQKYAIAQFNVFYEAGIQNYGASQWDAAVTNLTRSIELFDAARQSGGAAGIQKKDIERKKITAEIKSREARVEQLMAGEHYGQATTVLQEISRIIDRSPFKTEKEFAASRKEIAQKTAKSLFLDDIQQKTTYLTKNFEKIFKEKFSSSAKSILSEPKTEFVKKAGDLLIFKMQCTEQSRREKFNLVLEYQYNTTTKQWSYR